MSRWTFSAFALACGLCLALACDRNTEAFEPGEEPAQPDLSKIFPAGAERVRREAPANPPPPPGTGGRGAPAFAGSGPPVTPAAAPVTGTVRLIEGLEMPSRAVLFLIARVNEAGPPLAVQRIVQPELPLDFSLGPEDRMIPSVPFVGPLLISARIDRDGNAMTRKPGDLQGSARGSFQPGARGVDVVIDEKL